MTEKLSDTIPNDGEHLAWSAYEMDLISFEKLAELLHRNYYELREEVERCGVALSSCTMSARSTDVVSSRRRLHINSFL